MELTKEKRAQLKFRILSRVQRLPTGCWLWGTRERGAYPITKVDGRPVLVRRLVYRIFGLKPVLGGHTIRSSCRNPRCVSPDHLVREARTNKRCEEPARA